MSTYIKYTFRKSILHCQCKNTFIYSEFIMILGDYFDLDVINFIVSLIFHPLIPKPSEDTHFPSSKGNLLSYC